MKATSFALMLAPMALAGCGSAPPGADTPGISEMWVAPWIQEATANEAILREGTVYPYQFVLDSAELNDAGRRAVGVLAKHYAEHGGTVRIQQGDAADDLYTARVATVLGALGELGVASGTVKVVDAPPRGDGVASDRLVYIVTAPTGTSASMGDDGSAASAASSATEVQR